MSKKCVANRKISSDMIWCFLLLFIFFGFRDLPILNDTSHYYAYQREICRTIDLDSTFTFDSNLSFEPGFQIFSKIVAKYIWDDPYGIIFIPSLIVTVGLIWFVSKYTRKSLAFVLFICAGTDLLFLCYAATRQGLAAMLFLIAYYLKDKENKNLIPVFLILLAMQFHSSAVVCFIPFALCYLKPSKRNVCLYLFLLLVITIGLYPFLVIMGYQESVYFEHAAQRETFPLAVLLKISFYFFFVYYGFWAKKKYNLLESDRLAVWTVLTALFFALGSLQLPILGRFDIYFGMIFIIYFIRYFENVPKHVNTSIAVILFMVLLLRMSIVLEYKNEWYHLVPYSFYDFADTYHNTDFGY